MNNGFMSKSLAGAGDALAFVGKVGFQGQVQSGLEAQRGEILAKRDAFLQGQENTRSAAKIASDQSIHAAANQTQLDVADTHADAARDVANIGLMGKSDKGTVVPKGAVAVGADGKVLYDNSAGDKDELMAVPEGTKIIDKKTRQQVFENPKDPNAEGLPKLTKDTDQRVQMYIGLVKDHMGIGFMQKFNPAERKEFDQLTMNGADQVRNSTHPEVAFRSSLDALDRLKASVSKRDGGAGGATNPKVEAFRNQYQY